VAGLSGNKASGMFFEWNSLHHAPIRRFCGKIPYNIKKKGLSSRKSIPLRAHSFPRMARQHLYISKTSAVCALPISRRAKGTFFNRPHFRSIFSHEKVRNTFQEDS
jgi:hypothetical protein